MLRQAARCRVQKRGIAAALFSDDFTRLVLSTSSTTALPFPFGTFNVTSSYSGGTQYFGADGGDSNTNRLIVWSMPSNTLVGSVYVGNLASITPAMVGTDTYLQLRWISSSVVVANVQLFGGSAPTADAANLGPQYKVYPTATPSTFSVVSSAAKLTALGSGNFTTLGTGGATAALHDLAGSCPNLIDMTITNTRSSTASYSYLYLGVNTAGTAGIGVRYDSGTTSLELFDLSTALGGSSPATVSAPVAWTGGSAVLRVTYNRSTGAVSMYQGGVLRRTGNVTAGMAGTNVGFGSGGTNLDTWDNLVIA